MRVAYGMHFMLRHEQNEIEVSVTSASRFVLTHKESPWRKGLCTGCLILIFNVPEIVCETATSYNVD